MKWDNEELIGNHKAIITKELFDICQRVFEEHNRRANRQRKFNFLLRGFVYCGICGYRLTAEQHAGKKAYYHCIAKTHSNKNQNIQSEVLEKRVEELFEQIQLPEGLAKKIVAKAKEILSKTHEEVDKDKRLLMLSKVQLERKRDILENKLLEGVISDEVYNRQHEAVETELTAINEQIENCESDRKSNIDVFEKLLKLARNIGKSYREASPEVKQHYLSIFWDRIEVKDGKIKKAVPTKLYAELFPTYNFALTKNKLSNLKVLTDTNWRAQSTIC